MTKEKKDNFGNPKHEKFIKIGDEDYVIRDGVEYRVNVYGRWARALRERAARQK